MHSMMLRKSTLLKLAIPIALILVLAAFFSVQAFTGGSPIAQHTDSNPAYESVGIAPAAAADNPLPMSLYAVTIDPQNTVVTLGAGDVCTVTLTNNIADALANGTYGGFTITQNGDISGNLTLSATKYGPGGMAGGLVAYTGGSEATMATVPVICHPGRTVVVAVPIIPVAGVANVGDFVMLKAELAGAAY